MTEKMIHHLYIREEALLDSEIDMVKMQIQYSIKSLRSSGWDVLKVERTPSHSLPERDLLFGITRFELHCKKLKNPIVPCEFGTARLDLD